MHDIFCCWASEPWLMFNLSIKFPSDVNFVNDYCSHAKIWLYYVMFSSDLHYSSWHFPPPFFFPSLCWKEKLVLTMPEALSFIPHQRVSDSKSLYSRHPIWDPLLPHWKEFSGQPAPGGGRWRARSFSSHGQSPMHAQVPKHSGVTGQRLYLHTIEPGALTSGCFPCK